MSTVKIMDTCTLINVFDTIDFNLLPCLEEYHTVVTNHVVSEFTRKAPRSIPSCISVIGMNENDLLLMNEMELLFPQLGIGERSVFVFALGIASTVSKVIVLSDDKRATKKFSKLAKNEDLIKRFPGSENIVWGNTMSMICKFAEDGKITLAQQDQARSKLEY